MKSISERAQDWAYDGAGDRLYDILFSEGLRGIELFKEFYKDLSKVGFTPEEETFILQEFFSKEELLEYIKKDLEEEEK